MNAQADPDYGLSQIAAAIGEPARARILASLLDGRARTGTELAAIAGVSPSTASIHLSRLQGQRLIKVSVQGRYRYYSLQGREVAQALEALSVLAGSSHRAFVPTTPPHLQAARTCYDHIAGTLGVRLHDRFRALHWLVPCARRPQDAYDLSENGVKALQGLGVDVPSLKASRRRFAFACLDWSERRAHLGGALGAALFTLALRRRWVVQEAGSRALSLTRLGRREMRSYLGVEI